MLPGVTLVSHTTEFLPALQGLQPWEIRPILFAIVAILLTILTGQCVQSIFPSSERRAGHVTPAPVVPYWLPVIGHIPQLTWNAPRFLASTQSRYRDGAFNLILGGTVHTVLYDPSLITALLNTKEAQASCNKADARIVELVFGVPMSTEKNSFISTQADIDITYRQLQKNPELGELVDRTVQSTIRTISQLVSVTEAPVAGSNWERAADVQPVGEDTDGRQLIAANLLDLIRDYCALMSTESILGSDFVQNFPDFLNDLRIIDRSFLYLAVGLPAWVALPFLSKARRAQRDLIARFTEYENALEALAEGQDPDELWRNLHDVGGIIKERNKVFRKHDCSIRMRASCELALIWATNANSNMLIYWLLIRAFSNDDLLEQLREELAPYVRVKSSK